MPSGWIPCTCREAADLFYAGQDRGSDRAAGLMLDKLVALGLLQKRFDGNTLNLAIAPLPDRTDTHRGDRAGKATTLPVEVDAFDRRCDTIPVANLLAPNYTWMSHTTQATAYRIAGRLRQWAEEYGHGMRVLRRQDNTRSDFICSTPPAKSRRSISLAQPARAYTSAAPPSQIPSYSPSLGI